MITDIELAYHAESWGSDEYVAGLHVIGQAGFAGVEVQPDVARSFQDRVLVLQEMLHEVNLRLSAVEAVIETLNEESIEEAGLALLRYADFARQTGADVLVVRPPYRTKRVVEPDEYKLFFGFIAEIGKDLAKKGVKLCVRPELNTMIEKRTEIDALLQATPKKSVLLCPDTAHLLVVNISPVTLVQANPKRIGYLRIRDGRLRKRLQATWRRRHPSWRAVGWGAVKVKPIIKALDKIGYEGWVSASHPPPTDNPDRECFRAADALEKALDSLD